MKGRFIIGVGGGTGAGKTTLCRQLSALFPPDEVAYIKQDNYYHNLAHLSEVERAHHNYDEPKAFDIRYLIENLNDLAAGHEVEVPIYDYHTHTRKEETHLVKSHKIIILEGILVLYFEELRNIFDLKIFVDTPPDMRFIRRLQRDIKERGRTMESVIEQYEQTVRPMHNIYIEPCKEYADIIVSGMNDIQPIINLLASQMDMLIAKSKKNFPEEKFGETEEP